MLAVLALACVLAGCAESGSRGSSDDLPTASDQTDTQKRARIRLQLAVNYYEQGQVSTALDEVKQALQIDPSLADAYSLRALIYMGMNENGLADESFQRALSLRPNNPEYNNNYGWFLCQSGHPKEAMPHFEAALKSHFYQSPSKALNNMGMCSLKLKDVPAAEHYFSEAFRADPANPLTNANLAKLYYERRDYDRARFYINRAIKAENIGPDVLWLAIKIERKVGDRATETSLVAQLRRLYPNSSEYAAFQRGAYDE
jgi:type IV pilus assembly protein PilF